MNNKVLQGSLLSVVFTEDLRIKLISEVNKQEFDVFGDLEIQEDNLVLENAKQSQLYVKYGILFGLAVKQKNNLERQLNILSAKLDDVLRSDVKEKGEKPTETAIKRLMYSNEEYVELLKKVDTASEIIIIVKEILEALKQRKECLLHYNFIDRIMLKSEMEEMKQFGKTKNGEGKSTEIWH